ncbi:unnamed protein product [Rhizopus microsporus]
MDQANRIVRDVKSLAFLGTNSIASMLQDDVNINRQFEQHDPLQGNVLVTIHIPETDYKLFIFATGESLSRIVVAISRYSDFSLSNDSKINLPLDELDIITVVDLQYPVRQVTISPLSNHEQIIFAVRTTSTISLYSVNDKRDCQLLHTFIFYERTVTSPQIDYSMPNHVVMSPYKKYDYLCVTTNGYVALIDGKKDEILFEGRDNTTKKTVDYCSNHWSCAFGSIPSTYLIVSPESIRQWTVKGTTIKTKTITAFEDRIYAFQEFPGTSLYCYSTLMYVYIMDIDEKKPIVRWRHMMRDGPPTCLLVDKLKDNEWRLSAFSPHNQHLHLMNVKFFDRSTKPEIGLIRYLRLKKMPCENEVEPDLHIPAHGFSIESHPIINGDRPTYFYSVYRSFDNGSLHVQYITIDTEPASAKLQFVQKPRYYLEGHECIQESQSNIKMAFLPEHSLGKKYLREVYRINTKQIYKYLNEINPGSQPIDDETKLEIAEKARRLESCMTLQELIQDESYPLQHITSFANEMMLMENIEMDRPPELPSISKDQSKPVDVDLRSRLQAAHKKEIETSRMILHRPRSSLDHFQYLPSHVELRPTTTTRIMGSLWKIGEKAGQDLVFPVVNPNARLPAHVQFPRAKEASAHNLARRRRHSEISGDLGWHENTEYSMPTVVSVNKSLDNHTTTARPVEHLTQPLPGAFGSRPTSSSKMEKKKKKKTKVAGFK